MHPGKSSSSQGGAFSALRALDMFPKVQEDFFQKTMSGGVITLAAYTIMALLFLSEFRESFFFFWAAAAAARAAAAAALSARVHSSHCAHLKGRGSVMRNNPNP